MPLITEADFREAFNVNSGVPVDWYLKSAENRLVKWVGQTIYNDAAAGSPADANRAQDLKLAEAYLTMYFGYPVFNNRITQDGVVKTAREEGGAGGTILSYLTPAETKQGADYFLDRASEIAEPYLPASSTSDTSLMPTMFAVASAPCRR